MRRAVPWPAANHGPPSMTSPTIIVFDAPSEISFSERLRSGPMTPRKSPLPSLVSAPVTATYEVFGNPSCVVADESSEGQSIAEGDLK